MTMFYWMGGAPCAGKTTISQIIGQEFGWRVYSLDRHVEAYLQRATPEQHPTLTEYNSMGLKRFLSLPADEQLARIWRMSAEWFAFLLEDVQSLPADRPILVEGSNIRPQDVAATGVAADQVIWLAPREDFLLETYPRRGAWVQGVLGQFAQEERVDIFEQWMLRDAAHAEQTLAQAQQLGIRTLVVDGSVTLLENAEIVMRHFGLIA
jgi:hypothetical protein